MSLLIKKTCAGASHMYYTHAHIIIDATQQQVSKLITAVPYKNRVALTATPPHHSALSFSSRTPHFHTEPHEQFLNH